MREKGNDSNYTEVSYALCELHFPSCCSVCIWCYISVGTCIKLFDKITKQSKVGLTDGIEKLNY